MLRKSGRQCRVQVKHRPSVPRHVALASSPAVHRMRTYPPKRGHRGQLYQPLFRETLPPELSIIIFVRVLAFMCGERGALVD